MEVRKERRVQKCGCLGTGYQNVGLYVKMKDREVGGWDDLGNKSLRSLGFWGSKEEEKKITKGQ